VPEQKQVLWEDAAQPVTIQAWRAANGQVFDDERAARYAGCTHVACEDCGKPAPRGYVFCADCRERRRRERYAALPRRPWDGRTPVAEYLSDRFFYSWEEVEDCEEPPLLVHCRPCPVPQLDLLDFLCDWAIPDEEPDVPQSAWAAVAALNTALKTMEGQVWEPTDEAVEFPATEGESDER